MSNQNNNIMRKTFITLNLLLFSIITILTINSCSNGNSGTTNQNPDVFIEKTLIYDENIIGIVESYTSGLIVETEPLKVRFVQGLKMKKQYGEELPSKLFEITPKVAGHAIWLDNRTVGFQFDETPKTNIQYNVNFNLGMLVELPANERVMNFSFAVKKLDFFVGDIIYHNNDENCSYTINLAFTKPTNLLSASSILDKSTLGAYDCSLEEISPTEYNLVISNIKRNKTSYFIDIEINGKPLEINRSVKKNLKIPAKDALSMVLYNVNTKEKRIDVYFSDELSVNQNLTGLVKFSNSENFNTTLDKNRLSIFYSSNHFYDNTVDIILKCGIISSKQHLLYNDVVISDLNLEKASPRIKWNNEGVVVPDVGDACISFDAMCLNKVIMRIIKVYDSNILSFLQENDLSTSNNIRRVGRLVKKVSIPLNQTDYNSWETYNIKLSDYIDLKVGEMYQVNLDFDITCYPYSCDNEKVAKGYNEDFWDNESYDFRMYYYYDYDYDNPCSRCYYNYVDISKNLLVSDLALTAKSSEGNFIDIFAKSITDACPAGGVKLYLYDYQLQKVGEATTDHDGYSRVKCSAKPYCVVAEDSHGSKSYLPLDKNKSLSLSKFDVSGNAVKHDVDAFVYSNRDVWRPGDSIQLNLMVFDKDNYFADDYPVVMEVTDPNGRLYLKKANNSAVGKIYPFTINTLNTDPTGTWNAHFKIGNQVFSKGLRIETVKPNRLKIDFEPKNLISINQKDKVKLSSSRLNGVKIKDLKAEISIILRNTQTTFKDFEDYNFDCDAISFYSKEISLFSAALNAEGAATVSFDALKDISAPGFMSATYIIKVFENSGEFSTTSRTGKISPYSRYVGVSLPETKSKWGDYYFTDEDWKFNIVVVNENGTLCKNDVTLIYKLYKLDNYWWWDNDYYDLTRYVKGSYKRPVRSGRLNASNGRTSLKLNIKDADWGSYLLVVSDADGKHTFSKVLSFDWPYGTRSSSVGNAPALITLKTDKENYRVGEIMKVSFPANENSKAIVTVENNSKVIKVIHVQELNNDATVNIPITDDMLPNAYVAVSMIQPLNNGNGMPVRMYGVVPFKVTDEKTIIKPEISVPKTAKSNSTIDIKVSENQGRKMYYTLAVVDEGILGLTNYRTADPCSHFFSKRALGVRTWDNYDYIMNAITDMMYSSLAVGGDIDIKPENTLLERFQAVATMMGPFELKAGATDIQYFNIPDYNGSLRVMVVASNGKDAFGHTYNNVSVKDKIMISPTAPRTIGTDDELVMNMSIIASEFAGESANLIIRLENLTAIGALPSTVKIGNDGVVDVPIRVKAKETKGNAKVTMNVSCNGFESTKSVSMPIRIPSSNKYKSVSQMINPNETATLHIDCQGFDGTIETKLVANTGIPIDLFKHINYLTSYPYGCLEQKVSKAFPQLYLQNLITLDETTKADMKANINNVIADMNAFLRPDFSMTSWPNGKYVDPWCELYALQFLIEARNQGYNISNSLIDGMIRYQTNKAKTWNQSIDAPTAETIQAYRLFVLALNNTAEVGAMNRFKNIEMNYPLTKALTAAAYALIGKVNIAEKLIPVIDFNAKGCLSDYYTTFGSKVRDMSMCIYAEMLTDDNTEAVQNDINELCRILGSDRWLDTQTTAMAIFVVGKYAEKIGIKDNSISLLIANENDTKNISTSRSSISYNIAPKRGDNAVTITNNGSEPVVATLFTKGTVAEYQREDDGAWYDMTVKYLDKEGNEINTERIRQNTDFEVVITVSNPHEYQVTENALTFQAASGWEIVNSRLFGDNSSNEAQAKHIDYQDDHVDFIFDLAPYSSKTFRLSLNAASIGTFIIPSVTCEDMYNNQIWYKTAARKTTTVK